MTIDRQADAALMYLETGLNESVDFKVGPRSTAREDLAVKVRRDPVDPGGGDDRAQPFAGKRGPVLVIQARNHATLGILPSEVVPDVSQINVAFPLGSTARYRNILRVLKQTPGLVLLEVQT